MWNAARQPATGLFAVDWRGPSPGATACAGQNENNAAMMALQLFADLECESR